MTDRRLARVPAKAYHAKSMMINHPSALSAIAAGLAKTAGVAFALGIVYPHAAATMTHTATFISHLASVSHLSP